MLHNGATAELLHIAERMRSNASSVKAKRGKVVDEACLRHMKRFAACAAKHEATLTRHEAKP